MNETFCYESDETAPTVEKVTHLQVRKSYLYVILYK